MLSFTKDMFLSDDGILVSVEANRRENENGLRVVGWKLEWARETGTNRPVQNRLGLRLRWGSD